MAPIWARGPRSGGGADPMRRFTLEAKNVSLPAPAPF
jgi:hypothetical protein